MRAIKQKDLFQYTNKSLQMWSIYVVYLGSQTLKSSVIFIHFEIQNKFLFFLLLVSKNWWDSFFWLGQRHPQVSNKSFIKLTAYAFMVFCYFIYLYSTKSHLNIGREKERGREGSSIYVRVWGESLNDLVNNSRQNRPDQARVRCFVPVSFHSEMDMWYLITRHLFFHVQWLLKSH